MDYPRDFVLIKGVLIHINPESLNKVFEFLYNPTPVEVNYHGYRDKLFEKDYAGEMLDRYSDLELIDYEFVYHRDNNFPQDNVT